MLDYILGKYHIHRKQLILTLSELSMTLSVIAPNIVKLHNKVVSNCLSVNSKLREIVAEKSNYILAGKPKRRKHFLENFNTYVLDVCKLYLKCAVKDKGISLSASVYRANRYFLFPNYQASFLYCASLLRP